MHNKLTPEQKKALREIIGGADIFSPFLARTLRGLQQSHPELLTITKPMNKHDGAGIYPYFGAIITAKGKRAIATRRKAVAL